MANNRKVQGEIDKLLKKIQEGMDTYEEIYEKFTAAGNQGLKERFEGDLKKEIKKLQRLREQIKALLGGGDVKDKKSLETARRNIELKMEAFKICERETKTKAFSKEGLAGDSRSNPKAATAGWIREALNDLREQVESLEYDLENEGGKRKKGAPDPKEERLTTHKFHIVKLEQLLRLLENEELTPEDVDAICDDVQSYVENNGEEGAETYMDIYDDFDLPDAPLKDDDSDEDGEYQPKKEPTPKTGTAAAKPKEDTPPTKSTPTVSKKEPAKTPAAPAAAPAPPAAKQPAKTASGPASPLTIPAPKTLAAAPGKTTPATNTPTQPPKQAGPAKAFPASPTRETLPAPVNYAAAAQGGAHRDGSGFSPLTATSPVYSPTTGTPAGGQTMDSLLDEEDDGMNEDTFGDEAMGNVGSGSLAELASMTTDIHRGQPPHSLDREPREAKSSSLIPPPRSAQRSEPTPASTAPPAATAAPAPVAPQAAPAGTTASATSQSAAQQSHSAALAMLEQSARNLPHPLDSEKLKPYLPPNPYKTPAWYPQVMHPSLSSPETLARFEIEALFFIFYYQPNTYQQLLAARELKKQSWRYHKRYLTWFQRHNSPKETTEEHERGSYIYFDYESGWCQRIKNDFIFKYQYLEDELV